MLRPYQKRAVDEIREHARTGGSGVILQMATGAGKTKCFTEILSGAYSKGRSAIMVVRGKNLVLQASERLERDGVPHGIYQGANTTAQNERVLVCSVDTLYARKTAPAADVVVIDEAHLSHSDSYAWLLAQYPRTFKIGVSATPHHKRGMRHIADKLIMPVRITELIADGYLVGARYFVPYAPDLSGIKKVNGEFAAKELGERSAADTELTANAAKVWSKNLQGKRTLVYATSVEHAAVLTKALRAEGARVETITATTSDAERARLIAALESQELDAISSVGVLTTGVDIPPLQAILCCRPTASYNLWIQIVGRGTRPFPGKSHFDFYDLSGNIQKHGPIEAELVGSLDGLPETKKTAMTTCGACFAIFETGPETCPECGASLEKAKKGKTGDKVHGKLTEDVAEYVVEPWEIELPGIIDLCRRRGWKKGAVFHLVMEKHGEAAAEKAWRRVRSLKQWPVATRQP